MRHRARASARSGTPSGKLSWIRSDWSSSFDRLVRQGLRHRESPGYLAPSEVQEPIQAVRQAVGQLAQTTPSKFSNDYDRYNRRVRALIAVGRSVLDRGLEPSVKLEELDEWTPFRGAIGLLPSKTIPCGLGTGQVESLTGYAARISARIAVPTPVFVRRVLQNAQGGAGLPLRSAVVAAVRRLNVGERSPRVAAALGRLTRSGRSRSLVVLRLPRPPWDRGPGRSRYSPPVVSEVLEQ